MATSKLHRQSMMSRLCAGIAEGTPVAPMADSQAWPQPATQQQVDDIDEGEHDAPFEDAGGGFQDDSDGENGYQAGGLHIQLITFRNRSMMQRQCYEVHMSRLHCSRVLEISFRATASTEWLGKPSTGNANDHRSVETPHL